MAKPFLPLLQDITEKDSSSLEKTASAFLNDSPRPRQPMHYALLISPRHYSDILS